MIQRGAHSNRGSRYLAIRYTERLAEEGIEPSVGSVGDSCDNALAETVIGLFETEVLHPRGPWRSLEAAELATLEWIDWFDTVRSHAPAHPPRADRACSASRGRGGLPRANPHAGASRVAQTRQAPRNLAQSNSPSHA